MFRVTLPVSLKFAFPVVSVRFRRAATSLAVVLMPETTVNKDYFSMARQNQIGATGQRANMKSVTVPVPVNYPPHDKLGLSISVPNKSHLFAALCGRECVYHAQTFAWSKAGVSTCLSTHSITGTHTASPKPYIC